ncbi:MAG: ATP phosphoribosyltransferase regulatory subunit [Ruminococcus sp.]
MYSSQRIDEILTDLKKLSYQDISRSSGTGRLTVDLGMVNNADYYTGVIIKGYLRGHGEEVLPADGITSCCAILDHDIPATGFAVNVDAVSNIVRQEREIPYALRHDAVDLRGTGYEMKAVSRQSSSGKGMVVEYGRLTSWNWCGSTHGNGTSEKLSSWMKKLRR